MARPAQLKILKDQRKICPKKKKTYFISWAGPLNNLARAPPVGYINWILGGMGIGFEL
jgi:hypothetical protein